MVTGKWTIRMVGITVVMLTGWAAQAQAGVIHSFNGGSGPGMGSVNQVLISTPRPHINNDNRQQTSPNNLHINEKIFEGVGYIDLQFTVHNSGGTTEYHVFEKVTNHSGVDWTDFHYQLGFGVGSNFVLNDRDNPLDFDWPGQDPTPTSQVFNTLEHHSNTIGWFDGLLENGQQNKHFTMFIDVPDFSAFVPLSAAIYDNQNNIIGYQFTLRQYPTFEPVPEPSTMVLLGTGLVGLYGARWRKRKGIPGGDDAATTEVG